MLAIGPPEVILLAVCWYVRFGLSYRDAHMTYSTTARGVDRLLFSNNILDLTPTADRRTGKTRLRVATASHLRVGPSQQRACNHSQ